MRVGYLTAAVDRLHPKRVTFAVVALAGFLALLVIGELLPQALPVLVPLAGPLVFLPWVIFCACTWFHPERGTLRTGPGGRLATLARTAMRWYAELFIGLGVLFALVVWPVLGILWL
jgi:hypothetical protein